MEDSGYSGTYQAVSVGGPGFDWHHDDRSRPGDNIQDEFHADATGRRGGNQFE
jgi:hypothetical protein